MKTKISKGNIYYLSIALITVLISLDSLGQLAGRLGLVTMAWVLLLTTRLKMIEDWYGGLDKNYHNHKILGVLAFGALIAHPIALKMPLFFGQIGTINIGVAGLHAMILGIVLTVLVKLPYDKWKLSHKIMGVAFLLGAWHGVMMSQGGVKWWLLGWGIVGAISFVYTTILYKFVGPRYEYRVTKIRIEEKIVLLEMEPVGRKMMYKPGQFAYFQFEDKTVGKEVHPFSLASDPSSSKLTIAVKNLGDYSSKMGRLEKGVRVNIWGPYGKFFDSAGQNKKQIWVAGGIGITPFLSMTRSLKNKEVVLFYLTKNKTEAIFNLQFENKSINLINWYSEEKGRLRVADIKKIVANWEEYEWFVCGSREMMEDYKKELANDEKYNYENFSFLG